MRLDNTEKVELFILTKDLLHKRAEFICMLVNVVAIYKLSI